jgi:Fe-S-cluster containining protein
MTRVCKLNDLSLSLYDRFNIARYKEMVKQVSFNTEREHTDGLCCFLPESWRIDKDVTTDLYLVYGFLRPDSKTHDVIYDYEGKAPSVRIPLGATPEEIERLMDELDRLRRETPHQEVPIPVEERFILEGDALPACRHLEFKVEDGVITNSCSIYERRDKYCREYPIHGTSMFEPLCIHDAWSTKPNVFEMDGRGVQVKFFALKDAPEELVLIRFMLDGEEYGMIPVPLPEKRCRGECLGHEKYIDKKRLERMAAIFGKNK